MSVSDGPKFKSARWYDNYPRALPVGIFLLTSAVTAVSVFAIERAETQREIAQLEQSALTIASAIERRANTNSAYLRSGAALFATQRQVPGPLFRNFISELRLESNYPASEGIGWGQRVEKGDLGPFQAAMRAEGRPTFAVRPPPSADQAFAVPVTFLEPATSRNRMIVGYNMFSEPVRRTAMLEAIRTGQPTATGRLNLLFRPPGQEAGFLIYMPVFETIAGESSQRLKGFVFSPFQAQRFLVSAIEGQNLPVVAIRLFDGDKRPENALASVAIEEPSGNVVTRDVQVAGRAWQLAVESVATPMLSRMSLLTLLFGLLVATLLLVLARLLTRQALEDRKAIRWFEEQASIRNSLTRELNHRVKNTLANVLSIVALTRRRARNLDEFAEGLDGRIRALSATHDLLTQSEWGTTPIKAVIGAELAPYAQSTERHLDLSGPDVELAPNDALSLGLAIHELATNAAKYGALSSLEGRVRIRWELVTNELARVEWEESGGPPVKAERKRGFGTDLIEKIVAHELQNPVDLRFEPEGVRCSLLIPVRMPAEFAMRARAN